MIENIKAVFFDLDDTLINFGGVTKEAWVATCQEFVKDYPQLQLEA